MTKDDSKEKLALKKSPVSSKKSFKSGKTKNFSKKGKSKRESPDLEIEEIPEKIVMKEINFQKEKYMSARKVSELIKVAGGITLYDKNEVTKGPELNMSSRHMSIKDFNL